MAESKFILKDPRAKSEILVYLLFRYLYKRFKYSTGEKINPKYWNPKIQRARNTSQFTEHPEFNERLNIIGKGIKTVFRRLLNDGIQQNNENLKFELEKEIEKDNL